MPDRPDAVERVARHLFEHALSPGFTRRYGWDDMPERARADYRARAAEIVALLHDAGVAELVPLPATCWCRGTLPVDTGTHRHSATVNGCGPVELLRAPRVGLLRRLRGVRRG